MFSKCLKVEVGVPLCCSQDCGFSQWSTWSDYSLDGLRSRMRRIEQQASGGGMTCLGPMREVGHCAQAPSVDCKTSDWTSWDACDRSCGGGQQQRHRLVTTNPRGDGAVCPEDLMEVRGCAQFPCGTVDVDLSDWEELREKEPPPGPQASGGFVDFSHVWCSCINWFTTRSGEALVPVSSLPLS